MSDLPHPDRCRFCAMAAEETGGVVSLCLDHETERNLMRRAKRFAAEAEIDKLSEERLR